MRLQQFKYVFMLQQEIQQIKIAISDFISYR